MLKHIKFHRTFGVDVDLLEKVKELECECLELNGCMNTEMTFKDLLGMNEGLVEGQEYTFQIKNQSFNLVKSQMPPHQFQDKFKYLITYAQGKQIVLKDLTL